MAVRLKSWCLTVGVMTAAGAVSGWAVGLLLSVLSLDYVVVPSWYAGLGLRIGLFSGTFLAACQVVTERPLPSFKDMLHGYLVLCVVAGGLFCLVLVVAAVVPFMKESLPQHGALAHPRRYFLYRVGHVAWLTAIPGATVISGIFLFRRRAAHD